MFKWSNPIDYCLRNSLFWSTFAFLTMFFPIQAQLAFHLDIACKMSQSSGLQMLFRFYSIFHSGNLCAIFLYHFCTHGHLCTWAVLMLDQELIRRQFATIQFLFDQNRIIIKGDMTFFVQGIACCFEVHIFQQVAVWICLLTRRFIHSAQFTHCKDPQEVYFTQILIRMTPSHLA